MHLPLENLTDHSWQEKRKWKEEDSSYISFQPFPKAYKMFQENLKVRTEQNTGKVSASVTELPQTRVS